MLRAFWHPATAGAFLTSVVLCAATAGAEARAARCFTSDEGNYACDFHSTASDGSFEISAQGKPTYSLVIDSPDVAFGFVKLGGRNTALPGRYKRDPADRACWVNDATSARICAR